jgi:hypothetical protein
MVIKRVIFVLTGFSAIACHNVDSLPPSGNSSDHTDDKGATGTDQTDSESASASDKDDIDNPDCVDTGGGPSLTLTPDENGWIDAASNDLGIQGEWYTMDDGVSSIDLDGQCASGVVAPFDFSDDLTWGVSVGFDLCRTGDDHETPNESFTLSECPLNENLAEELLGISFDLTGNSGDAPLQVAFMQSDARAAYVEADGPGHHRVLFADARIFYEDGEPPGDIDLVESISFVLFSDYTDDIVYDFCIKNLRVLTEGFTDDNWEICQECVPEAYRDCVGQSIYWFDSCGAQGDLIADCAPNNCEDGFCVVEMEEVFCSCSCTCSSCTSTVTKTCTGPDASENCSSCEEICRETCTSDPLCGSFRSASGSCY